MPFIVETLTPVTEENIANRTKLCDISSVEEVRTLSEIIQSAVPTKEHFGEDFVRVRVARQDQGKETLLALVDKEGTVRGGTQGVRQLPPERLATLKRFLAQRCAW